MNTIIEDLFEFVIDRYPEIALEAVDSMRFGMLANDRNRKREEAKTSIEPIEDDPQTTAFIADLDEIRSKIKPMKYSPLMPSQAMCLKKGQVVFLSDHSTDDFPASVGEQVRVVSSPRMVIQHDDSEYPVVSIVFEDEPDGEAYRVGAKDLSLGRSRAFQTEDI